MGNNKYNVQNIQRLIDNLEMGLKFVDLYYVNKKHVTLIDKMGYLFYVNLHSLLKGHHPPRKFDTSNIYTIQNIILWCKLEKKLFELISNKYEGNKIKLKWQCLKDGCKEVFEANWSDISQEKGCGYCCVAPKQVGISNCLATKNPILASEWHPTENGDLTPYDVTENSNKKVWWKCKECGREWPSTIGGRSFGNGCPECSESKGEKECKRVYKINKFVEITQDNYNKLLKVDKINNIYFISQKTFKGLLGKGGKLLSYDFYVPKYNLIEYQGQYHDGTAGNQTKKDFETQKEHDRRKKEYALEKEYNFLEIWYYDFDNIEDILVKYFKQMEVKSNNAHLRIPLIYV